jgi:hypothetical protein
MDVYNDDDRATGASGGEWNRETGPKRAADDTIVLIDPYREGGMDLFAPEAPGGSSVRDAIGPDPLQLFATETERGDVAPDTRHDALTYRIALDQTIEQDPAVVPVAGPTDASPLVPLADVGGVLLQTNSDAGRDAEIARLNTPALRSVRISIRFIRGIRLGAQTVAVAALVVAFLAGAAAVGIAVLGRSPLPTPVQPPPAAAAAPLARIALAPVESPLAQASEPAPPPPPPAPVPSRSEVVPSAIERVPRSFASITSGSTSATPAAEDPAAASTDLAPPRSLLGSTPPDPPPVAPAVVPAPPPARPNVPVPNEVVSTAPVAAAAVSPAREATPPPTAPSEVLPTRVNETEAIQVTLSRYRTAFSALDATAARAVWPTVDQKALGRAFDQLEAQSLTFDNCAIDLSGVRALATCRGTAQYVPKVGNRSARTDRRQWIFNLRKVDEQWTINAVNSR